MTIDPLGTEPVYRQLAALLRGRIVSGDYQADQPLPSYNQLIQEHGLARGTVVKAVGVLINEGLVRVVPGKGVFVNKR